MRTFEEHQKGLQTTNSELKEEELRVKLQLAQVERELNSLRVLGHELKCQTTAIYTNITRITSKVTRQAPVVTCTCGDVHVYQYTCIYLCLLHTCSRRTLRSPSFLGMRKIKESRRMRKINPSVPSASSHVTLT